MTAVTNATTTAGVVIYAGFTANLAQPDLPAGCQDIDDLVAEDERDPVRRAAIEAGRRVVAERHYSEAGGLAALRLGRGWSQRTLADASGIKQPHIARLESGVNDPSLATMRRLAAALDVGLADIVHAFDSSR